MGLVRLSSLRLCNHVTDQFSRFELTRGRKPVEMNSGLSGYELISICWHLFLPGSSTSCRLRSLEPLEMARTFTADIVIKAIKSCRDSKAFGPDKLSISDIGRLNTSQPSSTSQSQLVTFRLYGSHH